MMFRRRRNRCNGKTQVTFITTLQSQRTLCSLTSHKKRSHRCYWMRLVTCWPGPSAEMCRGICVVYILEDFAGDFSGGFFWELFFHKNEDKKSGDRIRKEIQWPQKNPRRIRSAKNRPWGMSFLQSQAATIRTLQSHSGLTTLKQVCPLLLPFQNLSDLSMSPPASEFFPDGSSTPEWVWARMAPIWEHIGKFKRGVSN